MLIRSQMKKEGEDFTEHSPEGFLRGFTIQLVQRRVCIDNLYQLFFFVAD